LKGDQVLTYFANLAPCVAHQAGIGAHTALQWQQRSRWTKSRLLLNIM